MRTIPQKIALCQARWADLQQREQRFVLAGAVFLSLILLYFFVLAPWVSTQRQLDRDLPRLRAHLAQMQAMAVTARQVASQPQRVADPGAVAKDLHSSLVQIRLTPEMPEVNPDRQGRIRLRLENANFDAFLLWLENAQKHHRFKVVSAKVNRTASPGVAMIDLLLAMPDIAPEKN